MNFRIFERALDVVIGTCVASLAVMFLAVAAAVVLRMVIEMHAMLGQLL